MTIDRTHIERLLERYYQGSTTPEQEQELARIASSDGIPTDLASQLEIFRCLGEIQPSRSECAPPPALLNRLNAILTDEPAAPVIQPKPKRNIKATILWLSGMAVAASLTLVLLTQHPERTRYTLQPQRPVAALTTTTDDTGANPEASAPVVAQKQPASRVQAPREASRKVKKTAAEASDGYIEITDPEQALLIAQQIQQLLADNLGEAHQALERVDASLENYREITKTILQ